jgi:hypothetical protein
MTVDHLPQPLADLAEADGDAEASEVAGGLTRRTPRAEKAPEPATRPETNEDEGWPQTGFGSFP